MGSSKPGEPMFSNLKALKMACDMLGLEMVNKREYTWFNRHVGDYPVPEGVKVSDLGKNAEFVVKLNAEMTAKHGRGLIAPYEIGMMADPNNPGCFVPIYDFYGGGYGLEAVIGRPLFEGSSRTAIKMLCPRLKQHYDMCCEKLAAIHAGDNIQFLTAQDAFEKYPHLFPEQPKDTDAWVSIADTSTRIQSSK